MNDDLIGTTVKHTETPAWTMQDGREQEGGVVYWHVLNTPLLPLAHCWVHGPPPLSCPYLIVYREFSHYVKFA